MVLLVHLITVCNQLKRFFFCWIIALRNTGLSSCNIVRPAVDVGYQLILFLMQHTDSHDAATDERAGERDRPQALLPSHSCSLSHMSFSITLSPSFLTFSQGYFQSFIVLRLFFHVISLNFLSLFLSYPCFLSAL